MAAQQIVLHYYREDIFWTDPEKRFTKIGESRDVKIGSTVVIEQANVFDSHNIVLYDTELATILSLEPKTRVHIEEVGAGIVAKSVIMSPSQQITETGEGEITLKLPNLTEECRWIRTGMGYRDQQEIQQVFANYGALTKYDRSYPDYSVVNNQGIAGYDNFGRMVTKVFPGGPTGWSARYIDTPGSFVPMTAPLDWTGNAGGGYRYATYDGNTLKADPSHFPAGDAGGVGRPTTFDLAHDAAYQWQIVVPQQALAAGLGPNPLVTFGSIAFGFSIANGVWRICENGVLIGNPGTFGGNSFFSVAYNAATGQILYFVNNVHVYTSAQMPTAPLVPSVVFFTTNAEITNAIYSKVAPPSQAWWKVAQDNRTQLGAALDLATDTDLYLRLARDAETGEPDRILEMGAFGQKSGLRLIDGTGGDARALEANDSVRVIRTIQQDGPDADNLVNLITPLGGGQGDNQVTVEHLWRILYDPNPASSPNYGRYPGGPNAAAGIVFAEYDGNYPIKRRATDAGGYEYYMTSDKSIPDWAEMQGGSPDSTYTYQQDAGVSNLAYQELTERGLYAATIGKFRKNDQPHFLLTVTTTGRGIPCRAADLVAVDFTGYGSRNGVSYTRLRVKDDFYVMKIVRTYGEDTTDDWTLSNLGRYAPSEQSVAADQARTVEALQVVTQNAFSVSMLGVTFRELDAGDQLADHSIIYPIKILPTCFQVQAAFFRVDFYPFRQTATILDSGTHHHDVHIDIPDHDHGPVTGLATDLAEIGGMPKHIHQFALLGNDTGAPASTDRWLNTFSSGGKDHVGVANSGGSSFLVDTNTNIPPSSVDLSPTSGKHAISGVSGKIAATHSFGTISTTTAITDDAGVHHHDVTPKITDTLAPYAIQVWIDGGTGEFVNRTAEMIDLTGNQQGNAPGFTQSFEFECSRFINAPGRTVRLKFVSIGGPSNPLGIGCLGISGTIAASYGGLGQIIRQQQ